MAASNLSDRLNLILLGKTGAGKSASGNTILGRVAFESMKSSKSVTHDVRVESGTVDHLPVTVYDTPGLFDTDKWEYAIKHTLIKTLQECESGPCVFLLVIKADRFTEEEREAVEKIEELLVEEHLEKTWILFTRGDDLEEENTTIQEYINLSEPLKKVVQKYDQRYHMFNNKTRGPREQVRMLLEKITQRLKALDIYKMEQNKDLNVVLLGKTGAGISSTGNTILGRQAFISKKSSRSVTRDVAVESGSVGHFPVTVYDTPGLFNTYMCDDEFQRKYKEVLQRCESGPCVFLLVIKADRFTEEEREAVEKIEQLLGEERLKKTWILFTRGDELEEENMTIEEFINETEALKNLVQKYNQRYHVLNNKTKDQAGQVQELFIKIIKSYFDINFEEVSEIQNPAIKKRPKDCEQDESEQVSSLSSRRLVLLGKSGVGKSAAGNTILGQRELISLQRMSSVTSECSEAHATVSGRSVSVVDTPGFFDTQMKPEELMMEIARSVYLSSPGPHAFLIVFPVNMRFTEHEQQIPQMIEMMFGQEVLKYSFILFSHGDLLDEESVEELIEQNCRLRDLVQKCGGRYHVFNNKDLNNREQVNDLLQKIDSMIEQNGGGHYSNQMFEDAQRFRREEEEQRKQQEERQIQEKIERVKTETEERVRAEYEAERLDEVEKETRGGFKSFLTKYQHVFVVAGATAGAIVAAPLGILAAPAAAAVAGGVAAAAAAGGVAAAAAAGGVAAAAVVTGRVATAGKNIAAVADGSRRRQRTEEQRKQQEEKQRQEEIERVKTETEERLRAAIEAERPERLRAARQREEERRQKGTCVCS